MSALVENEAQTFAVSQAEADALTEVGKRLRQPGIDPDHETDRAPSIDVSYRNGVASIEVRNAVGAFSLGEKAFSVQPKIPDAHFYHLGSLGEYWPRFASSPSAPSEGTAFLRLLVLWFLEALERATRGDLSREYAEREEDILGVRGRVDVVAALDAFYRGSLYFRCEFDELSVDTALNRVLRAALLRIRSILGLEERLLGRAQRLTHLFDDVGAVLVDDLKAQCDRRTMRYSQSLSLAKTLLRCRGIVVNEGGVRASCFLIPTPSLIEAGIRTSLRTGLRGITSVRRDTRQLEPREFSVNPDLLFEGASLVGDVKYKVTGAAVSRPDMYQGVAFAAAYGFRDAVIVSFTAEACTPQPSVQFGGITVHHMLWNTQVPPASASGALVDQVRTLLTGIAKRLNADHGVWRAANAI